jgi:hypothetical protein
MDARDAARALIAYLAAPAWAVSVAATLDEGRWLLVVRVDPNYRAPLIVPEIFEGYPVLRQWRRPNFAFQIDKYA